MSYFSRLVQYFRSRFQDFVSRRLKPSSSQVLDQRKLFIFPSSAGWGFLLTLIVLWLLGTNYESNTVIAFAFMLTSLFVVCILYTFANLSGIRVQWLDAEPTFQDEDTTIRLRLSANNNRHYENIVITWPQSNSVQVNLIEKRDEVVALYLKAKERGYYRPKRVLLETRYPLGVMRCWTWLDLDVQVLVYPKPIRGGELPSVQSNTEEGSLEASQGSEDFKGFRHYQEGESLRHVSWKHYARGQGMHVKEYAGYVDQRLWLDWEGFQGMDREARLSRLCFWVLELSKGRSQYGLRLPGVEILPDSGPLHKLKVLKALALFEVEDLPEKE